MKKDYQKLTPKQFLQQGYLSEALNSLLQILNSNELQNESFDNKEWLDSTNILLSKYEKLERENNQNNISKKDFYIEYSKLVERCLIIINEIGEISIDHLQYYLENSKRNLTKISPILIKLIQNKVKKSKIKTGNEAIVINHSKNATINIKKNTFYNEKYLKKLEEEKREKERELNQKKQNWKFLRLFIILFMALGVVVLWAFTESEYKAYTDAVNIGSIKKYKEYLERFPQGRYKDELVNGIFNPQIYIIGKWKSAHSEWEFIKEGNKVEMDDYDYVTWKINNNGLNKKEVIFYESNKDFFSEPYTIKQINWETMILNSTKFYRK